MQKDALRHSPAVAILTNLLLLVVCYMVVRLAFYLENHSLFAPITAAEFSGILRGGLRFDLAAIAYSNALYLVLLFLPWPKKEGKVGQRLLHGLFVLTNALCLAANLADAVYYPFIKRRATASIFQEFRHDDISDIIGMEFLSHWYLTLLFLVLLFLLWRLYVTPILQTKKRKRYYVTAIIGLLLSATGIVAGMRGGIDPELRPLHNGNAREYVSQPAKAVLVQNTPFSIFRTVSKHSYPHYTFFESEEDLEKVFSPVHQGDGVSGVSEPSMIQKKPNIVIILLESFSSEYSARLNPYSKGEGYMPFLDSLMSESLTFKTMMANGLSSIDAQASVFTSIPMMVESMMNSQATMNAFEGLGNYLKPLGYETAYFHGADNGSLSIDGFVKACGMDAYYGRTEYDNDEDWDHHWGIWDEPFFQFFAHTMSTMHEPFCTGLFSLTSHHPFQIPTTYRNAFPDGQLPIYKTVRYTDHALQRFFETARRQPWFQHTLFVITGDHTNLQAQPELINDYGRFLVPVVFYHPTDSLFRGCREGIAQQIDILPTVLHYVGYEGPYFTFGNDLLATPPDKTWAVNYINGLYQLTSGHYLLQFDGERTVALYDLRTDPMLQANLATAPHVQALVKQMETHLKAIVQQYTSRMNENKLTAIKK